jgi:anaerobic magnesium-protoporphyrin IX monomethyl ester cyclase
MYISHDAVDMVFMFPNGAQIRSFEHHLGAAYIQAYLAGHGYSSKQVVPAPGSTLIDCVNELITTDAKIVGFTCYDDNYFLVHTLASHIKRKKPETVVIVGGPTATFSDRLLLTHTPGIDICVRFEGEETTKELASLYQNGSMEDGLEGIAGISYRSGSSIIRTQDRELFGLSDNMDCCLDALPSPYLEGILNGTEGAGIITSRGCAYRCTYCHFSAMSKHTVRYHSVDRVIQELKCINEANIEHSTLQIVPVLDDAFSSNVRRAKEICERIIDEEIRLRLQCSCRADHLDEELIRLLGRAGFVDIFFGVESAVPKILHNIRKAGKPDQQQTSNVYYAKERRFLRKMREIIDITKRNRMRTSVGIILGLPGETMDDGLKTIEFIRDLGVDDYSHNYLELYSGTELFDTASSYGITFRHAGFPLPYETQHAYPVHEIPFLDNSTIKTVYFESAKSILNAFIGGPDKSKAIGNGISLALIEAPMRKSFIDSFKWLHKSLAVGGIVVVLGAADDTIDDFDLMRKDGYDSGLPTGQIDHLGSSSFPYAELIYEIINKPLKGKLQRWNPRFPFIRFSRSLDFAGKHNLAEDQLFPVFTLNEKADVQLLSEISDVIAQKVKSGAIGPKVFLDGVFLDGCRWETELCPALDLKRIVINQNGDILPCMTGQPLGGLEDSLQDLRNNVDRIYAKIRKERECEACPADSRCSKCLFPYPLNQQEYCELQRANSNIAGLVTRSNIANTAKSHR